MNIFVNKKTNKNTIMRKLLIILVLISCSASAQDCYKDLLVKEKTWNLSNVWDLKFYGSYFLDRDTVLGGKQCRVLCYEYVNSANSSKRKKDYGVFYEEGGKVYRYENDDESFSLYYDFTADVGDTIQWGRSPFRLLEVTAVDSVMLRGNILRRLTFKNLTDAPDPYRGEFTGQWIEGLGSDMGFLCFPYVPPSDGYRLMDCLYEGRVLYDIGLFIDSETEYERRMLSYAPSSVCSLAGEGTPYSKEAVVRKGMTQAYIMDSDESRKLFTTFDVLLYGDGQEDSEPDSLTMVLYESKGKVTMQQTYYQEYMDRVFPGISKPYVHNKFMFPGFILLYDFTLDVGDQYPCSGEVYVKETGTMTTRDGIVRKTMVLTNGLIIIEGIGCINSPLGIFGYQNQTTEVEGSVVLGMEFSGKDGLDGEPVYKYGDYLDLSVRNMGKSRIQTTDCPSIHDLQGRRLASPPNKGVYIQDGKKYVK